MYVIITKFKNINNKYICVDFKTKDSKNKYNLQHTKGRNNIHTITTNRKRI